MKKLTAFVGLTALPAIALGGDGIKSTVETAGEVINSLLPIAFALALLFFFYGLAMFILRSGEDKEQGKSIMIWGVVALFLMTAIYGIIDFIGSSLGIDTDGNSEFTVPSVKQQ